MYFRTRKGRMNRIPGWELDYFDSEEWLDVQDILDERDREHVDYTPSRRVLFRALDLCHYAHCTVAILAEGPYPNPAHATGVAFSLPPQRGEFVSRLDMAKPDREGEGKGGDTFATRRVPPTLYRIFQELETDIKLPWPTHGCLERWCQQGVLLWNSMPIHPPIKDFKPLTQEIVERLSGKGKIVFVLMGRKAQAFERYIDQYNNRVITVSHPSPRGQISARDKFLGSRVFSTVNAHLNSYLKEVIDWSL